MDPLLLGALLAGYGVMGAAIGKLYRDIRKVEKERVALYRELLDVVRSLRNGKPKL